MTCYKIVVAYDGTAYHGWQIQPDATTITQVLEDSFFSVFSQKISILGASRTDAGVHALGQIAIVRCPVQFPVEKIKKAWNNALPDDIIIKDISKIDGLIHPHAGVIQKTYWYHIFLQRPLPFFQRYGWFFQKSVNIDLLKKALHVFQGTHDFRSFCTGDEMQSTVRTVDSIDLVFIEEIQAYRIEFKARGFLRYMIRRIVGACLEVASRDKLTLDDLRITLLKRNSHHTLPNAPAKGLVLYKIKYKGEMDNG